MTRKTIQLLSSFLTCVILAACISGCEKSESDKAADQAKDIISKSNRMIKASSDKNALTQQDMNKIENIPASGSEAMLNQQRQRIAEEITERLTNAVGDFPLDDISSQMDELKNMPLESANDFDAVCDKMINLTGQVIEYSNSYSNSLNEINSKKLDAALSELTKTNAPLNRVSTEQGRRNSLKNAANLALTSIYLTKARNSQARLTLSDTEIHPLLLNINTLVHEVRKCNIDIAAAKSSKPTKAIADLKEQLISADKLLSSLSDKISTSKSDQRALEAEYNECMKKAEEFRNKYLEILNKADMAEGSEKYKLQMEANLQRVGTANMKKWAQDWIEQGKDTEMETFINSSVEITGGIHYETEAELVKLKLDSLNTQIEYYTKLSNNTQNRVIQLDNVINKLETSPDTTTSIDSKVSSAESRKIATIATINAALEDLKQFEANHNATLQNALEQYENAKDSLVQYISLARGFSEFDPQEINNILQREIQKLWEIDLDFYNSCIGVLDSIRSLPEMSDTIVAVNDSFTQKAAVAQQSIENSTLNQESAGPEDTPALENDGMSIPDNESVDIPLSQKIIGSWKINVESTIEQLKSTPDFTPEMESAITQEIEQFANSVSLTITDNNIELNMDGQQRILTYIVNTLNPENKELTLDLNLVSFGGQPSEGQSTATLNFINNKDLNIKVSDSDDLDRIIWEPVE